MSVALQLKRTTFVLDKPTPVTVSPHGAVDRHVAAALGKGPWTSSGTAELESISTIRNTRRFHTKWNAKRWARRQKG